MQIDKRKVGSVLVVKIAQPRLDLEAASDFKSSVAESIDAGDKKIVIDLSEVEFVDSSGLGSIVSALKRLGGQGNLVLSGARPFVKSTLKLTRMDRVFALYENEEEAVAAAGK